MSSMKDNQGNTPVPITVSQYFEMNKDNAEKGLEDPEDHLEACIKSGRVIPDPTSMKDNQGKEHLPITVSQYLEISNNDVMRFLPDAEDYLNRAIENGYVIPDPVPDDEQESGHQVPLNTKPLNHPMIVERQKLGRLWRSFDDDTSDDTIEHEDDVPDLTHPPITVSQFKEINEDETMKTLPDSENFLDMAITRGFVIPDPSPGDKITKNTKPWDHPMIKARFNLGLKRQEFYQDEQRKGKASASRDLKSLSHHSTNQVLDTYEKRNISEIATSAMNKCIHCGKRGCDLDCLDDAVDDLPSPLSPPEGSLSLEEIMLMHKEKDPSWVPTFKGRSPSEEEEFFEIHDRDPTQVPPNDEEIHKRRVEKAWVNFYELENTLKHPGNLYGLLYDLCVTIQATVQDHTKNNTRVYDTKFDFGAGKDALRMFKYNCDRGNMKTAVLIKCAALKAFSNDAEQSSEKSWSPRQVMNDYTHRFALASGRASPVPMNDRHSYP